MIAITTSAILWSVLICAVLWMLVIYWAVKDTKAKVKKWNEKHPYKARRERLNPEVERLLELDEIEEKIS
jgi:hypothetical protein